MKLISNLTLALLLVTAGMTASAREKTDEYCSNIASFMTSVKPDETREVTLRTFWGMRTEGNQVVMGSKTCEHNDYEPGKKLCAYLIEHSFTEFPGENAKRILNCLSPARPIAKDLRINSGSFTTSFGSEDRGAVVNLDVLPDKEPGEMVLRLEALGY
ncbi:hypothetical protein [Stenotrophomonas sp. PS02289]|uniref:hypothetical protein n=1 Tax=Stenotrophomonas sp. PS02289 TaxID=2991422 RepID=UPI00249BAB10|nr:hypothetical protein [Stenotrophomonas sp. PS02289]